MMDAFFAYFPGAQSIEIWKVRLIPLRKAIANDTDSKTSDSIQIPFWLGSQGWISSAIFVQGIPPTWSVGRHPQVCLRIGL